MKKRINILKNVLSDCVWQCSNNSRVVIWHLEYTVKLPELKDIVNRRLVSYRNFSISNSLLFNLEQPEFKIVVLVLKVLGDHHHSLDDIRDSPQKITAIQNSYNQHDHFYYQFIWGFRKGISVPKSTCGHYSLVDSIQIYLLVVLAVLELNDLKVNDYQAQKMIFHINRNKQL